MQRTDSTRITSLSTEIRLFRERNDTADDPYEVEINIKGKAKRRHISSELISRVVRNIRYCDGKGKVFNENG